MRKIFSILLLASLLALGSCIDNDIPYPVVKLAVESVEVEGVLGDPVINRESQTVTITLDEATDIQKVRIKSITYTEGATPSVDLTSTTLDMRYPQYVSLTIYDQEYKWTIEAVQNIDRRFRVVGQIGETEWDVTRQCAQVFRRSDYGRDTVTITSFRMGPQPQYDFPTAEEITGDTGADFNEICTVTGFAHGRHEIWRLNVELKDVEVEVTRAVPGAQVIWLRAVGVDGADTGFRYRVKGETEWNNAPDAWFTSKGGTIEAILRHLLPQTDYEIQGYAVTEDKSMESEIILVRTSSIFVLPNAGLEDWTLIDNKILGPFSSLDEAFWGTGNNATASLLGKENNLTYESSDTRPGSTGTKSAYTHSIKAAVLGIGKFAAGNLFVGVFDRIKGTNGIVNFGRPCTARPTALKGWLKFQTGAINEGKLSDVPADMRPSGDNDEGVIFVAMGDWDYNEYGGTPDCPVMVDTSDKSTLFTSNNKGIIAYGEMRLTENISEWREFNIPLEYRSFDRQPTHIVLVCTCSRFGDYFVGSTSSMMWLDDFELLFDLDEE